jgi:hypothetical protein
MVFKAVSDIEIVAEMGVRYINVVANWVGSVDRNVYADNDD